MTVEARHHRLMGIAEAAEYANVHPSTLRRRIADGQLPAYRVGPKLLKVDLDDVEALIRPCRSRGAADLGLDKLDQARPHNQARPHSGPADGVAHVWPTRLG